MTKIVPELPRVWGRSCVLLLAMMFVVPTLAVGSGDERARIFDGAEQVERLVVVIRSEFSKGAGVLVHVDDTGLYGVSAGHVLMDSGNHPLPNLRILTKLWNTYLPATLEKVDLERDLAVFRVPPERLPLSVAEIRAALRFEVLGDARLLERGAGVFPMGHPAGQQWVVPTEPVGFVELTASRADGKLDSMLFERQCLVGNSGGGVFDDSWRLVGLMIQEQAPYCRALMFDWVIERLHGFGIPISLVPAAVPAKRAVLSPTSIVAAVVDFDNRSGQRLPRIGSLAHDVLSAYLIGIPRVELVTRDRLEAVLLERGLSGVRLQKSDAQGALASAGQILKADVIVTGAVIRYDIERRSENFGQRYGNASATVDVHRMAISLQVIDVDTALSRFSRTYRVEQRKEYSVASSAPRDPVSAQNELLEELVNKAGEDLRVALTEMSVGIDVPGRLVRFPISSRPVGAEVIVDGIYAGKTPLAIDRRVGLADIVISAAAYQTWHHRVSIRPEGELDVALVPRAGQKKH